MNHFNKLDNQVIGENILPWLDPSSVGRFSITSMRHNQIVEDNTKFHPEVLKFSSGIEVPSYLFFEQLTPDQIASLGFDKPEVLQKMTQRKLAMLPEITSAAERMLANFILTEIWIRIWGKVEVQANFYSVMEFNAHTGQEGGYLTRLQFDDHIETLVRAQVGIQVRNQIKDQFYEQLGEALVDQLDKQIWTQFESHPWTQFIDPIFNQISTQFMAHIHSLTSDLPNLRDTAEDTINFVRAITPAIDKAISTYHYFFINSLFEPSENGEGSFFRALIAQFVDQIDDNIQLDTMHQAAKPNGWEAMNPNIRNFLLPIQKYSEVIR